MARSGVKCVAIVLFNNSDTFTRRAFDRCAAAAKSYRGQSLGDGFDDDGGEPRGGRRERAAAVV